MTTDLASVLQVFVVEALASFPVEDFLRLRVSPAGQPSRLSSPLREQPVPPLDLTSISLRWLFDIGNVLHQDCCPHIGTRPLCRCWICVLLMMLSQARSICWYQVVFIVFPLV